VLVVFGGDGTVHEVANGLPLAGGDGPLVVLLPAGTGNDLARALGLPPDPVAAAAELDGARPRALDLLDCGPRRAANGINAGFAAAATDALSRPLKKALGPAAYLVGGLRAGVNPPTWPARADVGDGLLDVLVVPAAVSKAKLARHLAMDNRLPSDLPRLRGPSVTLVTDMPCRLDGEPAPTPGSITVLPAAWRLLAPAGS
jgi:diacylglycerol kinase family enzyme